VAPNAGGVSKTLAFFDRSRSLWLRRLAAENLCPSATVVRVHDGALAEKYAVSWTTLVVLDVWWSQLGYGLVDTDKVGRTEVYWWHSWHRMLAVRWLRRTMRVQIYAGSRIKSGSCRKCCSEWHANYLRYSYNIGQHFNWREASRGSLGDSWACCFRRWRLNKNFGGGC